MNFRFQTTVGTVLAAAISSVLIADQHQVGNAPSDVNQVSPADVHDVMQDYAEGERAALEQTMRRWGHPGHPFEWTDEMRPPGWVAPGTDAIARWGRRHPSRGGDTVLRPWQSSFSWQQGTAWSFQGDVLTREKVTGSLAIRVTGKVRDQRWEIHKIEIWDKGPVQRYAKLAEVPEEHRAAVQKIVDQGAAGIGQPS